MLKKFLVFLLIFLPPAIIMAIGAFSGIILWDLTLLGGLLLGWVTFLAAVFQILGFDLKEFMLSGDIHKREIVEKKNSLLISKSHLKATTISQQELKRTIKEASKFFVSPLILNTTLSSIPYETPKRDLELSVILRRNIHIFRIQLVHLHSLELVEIIGENVKLTEKGKLLLDILKNYTNSP